MTPTKKNPVARAVKKLKPQVIPNKKKSKTYNQGFIDGQEAMMDILVRHKGDENPRDANH